MASVPPVVVRPVVHTTDIPTWSSILQALGARTLSSDPLWTEVEFDRGRITLSGPVHGASDGEVVLGLETADLTAYAAALAAPDGLPPGMTVEPYVTDDYSSLRVVARDGLDLLVDAELTGGSRPDAPESWVQAHWSTPNVHRAAEDLEALGFVRAADSDVDAPDFDAWLGRVLVRPSAGRPSGWGLSIAVTDLDAARSRLLAADVLLDEADGAGQFSVPFPGSTGDSFTVVARGA